jgi:hypothetical protein
VTFFNIAVEVYSAGAHPSSLVWMVSEIPQGGVDFGYEDHGGIFRPG